MDARPRAAQPRRLLARGPAGVGTSHRGARAPADPYQCPYLRAFFDEHPTGAIQFQHLRTYNSRLAKENGDALLSSHRQPYKRWDELCYELDDTSIEGRFVYTRNYVYPGKNGQTALHVTKVTKINFKEDEFNKNSALLNRIIYCGVANISQV